MSETRKRKFCLSSPTNGTSHHYQVTTTMASTTTTSTTTVKFNIGGQLYQVSRSLLDQHPDTMLSKITSERWQVNPESEIFIERDGSSFRYVLQYLRDGSVSLPITESKDAMIKEFEYYGITFEESSIDDTKIQMANCLPSIKTLVQEIRTISFHAQVDYHCAELAIFCLQGYLGICANWNMTLKHIMTSISVPSKGTSIESTCYDHIRDLRSTQYNMTCESMIENVNKHLNTVGLKLVSLEKVGSAYRLKLCEIDPINTEE